jgi:hypothetical protein
MNCIKNYFSETTVPFLKGNLSGMFLVWSCTKFVFYVDQKWTNNCLKGSQWKINKYLLWNRNLDWTQTALKWCYINKLIYNLWPVEFKGEPQLLILIFSWKTAHRKGIKHGRHDSCNWNWDIQICTNCIVWNVPLCYMQLCNDKE